MGVTNISEYKRVGASEEYVKGVSDAVDELMRFVEKPRKIIKNVKYLKEAFLEAIILDKRQREELVFTAGTLGGIGIFAFGVSDIIYNNNFEVGKEKVKFGLITAGACATGSMIFDRPFYEPMYKVVGRMKDYYYTIKEIESKIGRDIEGMLKERRKNPERFKNMLSRGVERVENEIGFGRELYKKLKERGRITLNDTGEIIDNVVRKRRLHKQEDEYDYDMGLVWGKGFWDRVDWEKVMGEEDVDI